MCLCIDDNKQGGDNYDYFIRDLLIIVIMLERCALAMMVIMRRCCCCFCLMIRHRTENLILVSR